MNDKKLLQFSRQKTITLGEAKVERVVPNALPNQARLYRQISDYGRRLERQAIAIATGGEPLGYLRCDSSRKTFLT